MKQDVEFKDKDDYFVIALIDNENYVFEKDIEPEDKPIKIGLTKAGEVRIKEINFPKTMYHGDSVRATADKIRNRFEQEGCKSCIALAEVSNTKKTFLVPTPRELIGDLLDHF